MGGQKGCKTDYDRGIQPAEKAIVELRQVQNNDLIRNSEIFSEDIEKIIQRLSDKNFRIAVVGEFSSGKSTFINALIGRDLLKHGAKETTATITEIENVRENERSGVFDVYYQDGSSEKGIPCNRLEQYTSTSSSEYAVAEEIERVVIKSSMIHADYPIFFIDTPGLNGIADHHREKTVDQIKNAHACIYLLQVRGLGQSDIDFIRFISAYQKNFIFIQNFIDELKVLEGETAGQKVEEQKRILDEKVFKDETGIEYEIVPVSAMKALVSRDYSFEQYNRLPLDESSRKRLYRESNFEVVLEKINQLTVKNKKESLQQRSAITAAIQIIEQILAVLDIHKRRELEEWEESFGARAGREYEKLKEKLISDRKKYQTNLINFVEAESDSIRKDSWRKIEEDISNLLDNVNKALLGIRDLHSLDEFIKSGGLNEMINKAVQETEKENNEFIQISFENMISNAILRITEYTGSRVEHSGVSAFRSAEIAVEEIKRDFSKEESEVEQIKERLAKEKAEFSLREQKKIELVRGLEEINSLISRNNCKIEEIKRKKGAEITELGAKPEAETFFRSETVYEKRGGLGILDCLLGPKEVVKNVPYSDYTKVNAWIRRKSEIENQYQEKIDRICAEGRILKCRLGQNQEDLKHLQEMEPWKRTHIENMNRQLESKIREIETKREMAQKEYLRNLKDEIKSKVKDYLYTDENVQACMQENIKRAVTQNREKAKDIVLSLYRISFEQRIAALTALIANESDKNNSIKSDRAIDSMSRSKKVLEEILCQI